MEYSVKDLLEMYSYKRPYQSATCNRFIKDFILPLEGIVTCKDSKNYILDIGDKPSVLFSSHTDTVHKNGGMQLVMYDKLDGMAWKEDKECLGADDATGVWLMLNMIHNKVEGRYVFHVGEEVGCIGSRDLSIKAEHWLEGIDYAIAFDRKGHTDVITHQRSKRNCSDDFAEALASELGMDYSPSDKGVYTDTAEYSRIVPECTNLSVGYEFQHTANETQDLEHVQKLLDALCNIEWAKLPVVRDPKDVEYLPYTGGYGGYYGGSKNYGNSYYGGSKNYGGNNYSTTRASLKYLSYEELYELVFNEPEVAVEMLLDLSATEEDKDKAEEEVNKRTVSYWQGKDDKPATDTDQPVDGEPATDTDQPVDDDFIIVGVNDK